MSKTSDNYLLECTEAIYRNLNLRNSGELSQRDAAENIRIAIKEFASQETASLKAENEELKKKLDFEIQVAEGQLALNKELTVEAIEIEAEITALKSEVERLHEGLKLIHDTAKYSYTKSEIVQSMEDIQTLSFKFLNSQQPKP